MARRKRSSQVLEKAQRRAASLEAIALDLDLGNGMSMQEFHRSIESLRNKITTYNRLLSSVDQVYNDMLLEETALSEMAERMLAAVSAKYGRRSPEYEMAGGSRRGAQRRVVIP
ncbi:MAG: hypothetical protein HC929_13450 [Leptolyngbyaceae cyanobacterium SM2_5_2]|nr:hypothetical protein [Leptolyngbyaceae cyanobacterium SM2_5_2]